MFKKEICLLFFIAFFGDLVVAQKEDSIQLRKITNEIMLHGKCYSWLDYLANKIGGRISGSPQAAAAVEYTHQLMDSIGADSVYLQPCMVPRWRRGEKENAKILTGNAGEFPVAICALGGSVATALGGITAEVVEVHSFEELKKLGVNAIRGKIVFYNQPFDETAINTFDAYGKTFMLRYIGASEAAKYGAVGTVLRSLTNSIDNYPHTGVMQYNDSVPNKLPCCAISTAGAEKLSKLLRSDPKLRFHFEMSCYTLPDVKSYNVIAEIKGSEHPEEIIAVGGHLDSWDLAQGANDDGAGVVQSLEVLRTFKALGIKPKRTIRIVLFMNEENGGRGAKEYAAEAKSKGEKHIVAMETDAGGETPLGFGLDGTPSQKAVINKWKELFLPYGIYDFMTSEGGADIDKLKDQGALLMGLEPDSQRYFDLHHAATDTFDKINKRELELGAAAMTMMIYMISQYGVQ
ncbi:MAG: M20/M25/M40 family metallo-hydrolase [Bacteroidia bacterium]